jgi:hypothetical protein
MKSNRRIDDKISRLIDDVQSYASPQEQHPSPPIHASPDRPPFTENPPADRMGPDHSSPPSWFERREPTDVGLDEDLQDVPEDIQDVPNVTHDIEVPLPTPAEEQELSTTGVEALAYYAPFHFYRRSWGMYIRAFGLVTPASTFLGRRRLTIADNWVLEAANEFLLQHEYFHFQTEIAVSCYEILIFQDAAFSIYLDQTYKHQV